MTSISWNLEIMGAHVWAGVLQRLRSPTYLISLFVFPTVFFTFFGAPYARTRPQANMTMVSYAAFSVLAVALLQFGVTTASERTQRWEMFLRHLPAAPGIRIGARIAEAAIFACISSTVVILIALIATPAGMSWSQWLSVAITLLLGGVPFALLGMAIGYLVSPRGAGAAGNLLYLPLAFIGLSARPLPGFLEPITAFVPTREWAMLLWNAAQSRPTSASHWLVLLGYAITFAIVAWVGYRRDEGMSVN